MKLTSFALLSLLSNHRAHSGVRPLRRATRPLSKSRTKSPTAFTGRRGTVHPLRHERRDGTTQPNPPANTSTAPSADRRRRLGLQQSSRRAAQRPLIYRSSSASSPPKSTTAISRASATFRSSHISSPENRMALPRSTFHLWEGRKNGLAAPARRAGLHRDDQRPPGFKLPTGDASRLKAELSNPQSTRAGQRHRAATT